MTTRTKWNLSDPDLGAGMGADSSRFAPASADARALSHLIEAQALTAHFQPIFSGRDGSIYACEALARIDPALAPGGPAPLFEAARRHGLVAALDRLCRQKALECAAKSGLAASAERLFINVCPETLMDEEPVPIAQLASELGIAQSKIVFEITEQSAVADYELFARAVAFYRDQGFQIAIDDFGVGYGGLKMLAVIEPDFVKIDRHFTHGIERVVVRRNLVDLIATACHRLGIKVIAEGIENLADAAVLLDMGVEFLQGFGLARPQPTWPLPRTRVTLPRAARRDFEADDKSFIGDIVHDAISLPPQAPMSQARAVFMEQPALVSLPIVEGELCVGMLHRKTFFEKQLSGPFGFGTALSTYKTVMELSAGEAFVMVEARETLEDVAKLLRGRCLDARYDDICVSSNGKYRGTVAMSALLDAITERSLLLARGSNPLSGLPGNEVIRREIEKRIAKLMHFDVCYIDIDNFKPFNDTYGFGCGDSALRKLATAIADVLGEMGDAGDFAGHIGGDDFLLITHPARSIDLCRAIIGHFEAALRELHGEPDHAAGCYQAHDRSGEPETFPLMSLSIGIVSTEVQFFESVAELASVASEVKKAAKKRAGSSIVRDRRLLETVPL